MHDVKDHDDREQDNPKRMIDTAERKSVDGEISDYPLRTTQMVETAEIPWTKS
jgi:hypothetical protein